MSEERRVIGDAIAWDQLRLRHQSIGEQLSHPSLEQQRRQQLGKEYALLSGVLHQHDAVRAIEAQLHELTLQEADGVAHDPEFGELIAEERELLNARLIEERDALDRLLYPVDTAFDRSVFLEVRAGTGGQEAALFAHDLMRMYMLYAAKKGWDASVVSMSDTDLGGIREAVLHIRGRGVYGHLRYESGVHRVQRVPTTETAGRVHTSTATVAVLPEADEVEVHIDPRDLRIDVYRSSGAGGQHVNTTDSAVRITHIPTGVVVACQDERSQHKNKAKALKVLQARIHAAQQEKRAAEESEQRKKLIGSGERAEKVRTYNVPQNRVTDHQVDVTLKALDLFFEGDMDGIIDALSAQGEAERRKKPLPWLQQ